MQLTRALALALMALCAATEASAQFNMTVGSYTLPANGQYVSPRSWYVSFNLFNGGPAFGVEPTYIAEDDLRNEGYTQFNLAYRFEAINQATGAVVPDLFFDVFVGGNLYFNVPTQQSSTWQGILFSSRSPGYSETYQLRLRIYDVSCGARIGWPSNCRLYDLPLATVSYTYLQGDTTPPGVPVAANPNITNLLPIQASPIPTGAQPPNAGLNCNSGEWNNTGRRITGVWFGSLGPYSSCP